MFKTPLTNALGAAAYIIFIGLGIRYSSHFQSAEPNLLIPIAMLSLLTVSVAIMGFFFVMNPLQLYIDGHKKEAASFFLQTIGIFAAITAALFLVVLLRA